MTKLPSWYRGRAIVLLSVARPPFPVSNDSVTPRSSPGLSTSVPSGPLTLQPRHHFALFEAPIFSEAESRNAIHAARPGSLIDPGHRYLQQLRNFLNAEERPPRLRNVRESCFGYHRNTFRPFDLSASPTGI